MGVKFWTASEWHDSHEGDGNELHQSPEQDAFLGGDHGQCNDEAKDNCGKRARVYPRLRGPLVLDGGRFKAGVEGCDERSEERSDELE